MKKIIGICCPVFNEETNIEAFLQAYRKIEDVLGDKYEIKYLFLDNNSEDKSYEILRTLAASDSNIYVLKYSKNFGVMKSIYTGLISSPVEWDAVAVFDCDLQDPPNLLLKLIEKYEKGYALVYGKRIDRDEPKLITILRNIYLSINNKINTEDNKLESGAWLIDKKIILELKKRQYFTPHIPRLIGSLGFSSVHVDYNRLKRLRGETKFNIPKYFTYAIDAILSGSLFPLRLSIIISIIFAIISISSSIYFIVAKFILGIEFGEGVAAIIIILLINFSFNFLILGILGEYIGRIYKKDESDMPAIIDNKLNF